MRLEPNAIESRRREFPYAIQQLADRNVVVDAVITAYAHGSIITYQEAMCRMVTELAQDWEWKASEVEAFAKNARPLFYVKASDAPADAT